MSLTSAESSFAHATMSSMTTNPALMEAMSRGLLNNSFDEMQRAGIQANSALQGATKLQVGEAIDAAAQVIGDMAAQRENGIG